MAEPAVAVETDPARTSWVRFERVGFRYGGDRVLAGIDLEIEPGERLAILGPNGGGKSTLVRLLLGLLEPSEGRVIWSLPRAERRLSYVPQFPAFDRGFPMRVEEMVLQGLLRERPPRTRYRAEDRTAVAELLADLELADLSGAYLSELSGGELKRALIARALIGRPNLLVLDEPTASLDEPSRRKLWQRIATLPATTAVLLVTHDLGPETFGARRAVLVDGALETLPVPDLHRHPLLCGHGHG